MATAADEHRVTPLELFFDLVFVLAITQVTGLLADDPTWRGLARGMLLLGALWWSWSAYAWLTNTVDADEGGTRLAMLSAMAAMLVVAIAVPGAFNENAFEFGVAYAFVRAMHLVLYVRAAGHTALRSATLRMVGTSSPAVVLILAASFFDGAAQGAIWAAALLLDYGGIALGRGRGWTLFHPHHFAERYGLIVLIALGESIVAIGIGASSTTELEPTEIGAALLGAVLVSALWWTYFDTTAIVAERRLASLEGVPRVRLARDSYSYLHLPLITGVVLIALGIKKTLAETGAPLGDIPAVALCGGVAVYLLAHVARRWRGLHTFGRHRFIAALVALALIPVARDVDALATLATLAALTSALVAYEALHFRAGRAQVRARA
jgi:low temperature requirement protein LtrA